MNAPFMNGLCAVRLFHAYWSQVSSQHFRVRAAGLAGQLAIRCRILEHMITITTSMTILTVMSTVDYNYYCYHFYSYIYLLITVSTSITP